MPGPLVWLRADDYCADDLEAALVAAGGLLVSDPTQAEVIMWAAWDPQGLRDVLHPGVKWVQLSSAGVEDWFCAGVIDRQRVWTAAKGVYAGPIAEYVVAAMLMAARDFSAVLELRRWEPYEPQLLRGSTVGIVGAGLIGEEILRLLRPFGVNTLALTRSARSVPGAHTSLGPDGLDDLLRLSDYLVLAAPDTPDTRGLLDARRLAYLRRGGVVINVGRGTIIDTGALVEALRDGRVRAAILDVTDPEPLPEDHPLWELPNAMVTSHTASTVMLAGSAFVDRVRENVERYCAGTPLLGLVDPRIGY